VTHMISINISSLRDATLRRKCLLSVSDDRPELLLLKYSETISARLASCLTSRQHTCESQRIANECQVECRWVFHRYYLED
jgi:hypothetical protein